MTEYVVIYERTQTGWGPYCPDLPGLGVVGASRSEVERLIGEAVELHIESLRSHGDAIPSPTSSAGHVVARSA